VLARRLRTVHGEVDLVVRDGDTLVCVEVKTGRRGPRFRPGMRLSQRALGRLSACVHALARRARLPAARVDLVEVLWEPGRPPIVLHHRDVRRPL
jgi:putative endonuclease